MSTHGPKLVYGDLNARIHKQLAGEERIVGPFAFGDPHAVIGATSNRQPVIKTCKTLSLVLANTMFEHSPEEQVSFYAIGASPMRPNTCRSFAQIDFCLCPIE